MHLNREKILNDSVMPWPIYENFYKEETIQESCEFFTYIFNDFFNILLLYLKERYNDFNLSEEIFSNLFDCFNEYPQLKIFLSLFENARDNAERLFNISDFISFEYSFILTERNLRNSIEALYDLYIILAEGLNDNNKTLINTHYYKLLYLASFKSNIEDDYVDSFISSFKDYENKNIYDPLKKIYENIYIKKLSKIRDIRASEKRLIIKNYLKLESDSFSKFNSYFNKEYEVNNTKLSFIDIIHNIYYKKFNNSIHPNIFYDYFFKNPKLVVTDLNKKNEPNTEKNTKYRDSIRDKIVDLYSFESKILVIALNLIKIYYLEVLGCTQNKIVTYDFSLSPHSDIKYYEINSEFLLTLLSQDLSNILIENNFDLRTLSRESRESCNELVNVLFNEVTNYILLEHFPEEDFSFMDFFKENNFSSENPSAYEILNYFEIDCINIKLLNNYISIKIKDLSNLEIVDCDSIDKLASKWINILDKL